MLRRDQKTYENLYRIQEAMTWIGKKCKKWHHVQPVEIVVNLITFVSFLDFQP